LFENFTRTAGSDDASVDRDLGWAVGAAGLEIDRLVRHGRLEQASDDQDLLERTLDTEPRALVGVEQAVVDAHAPYVGVGCAEQAYAVSEAVPQDAACDDEILGPGLDLDPVGLFVRLGQARAVPVDHEVGEQNAPRLTLQDEHVPVTGPRCRIDELHHRARPLARHDEVVDVAQVEREAIARLRRPRHPICRGGEEDAGLARVASVVNRGLDRGAVVSDTVAESAECLDVVEGRTGGGDQGRLRAGLARACRHRAGRDEPDAERRAEGPSPPGGTCVVRGHRCAAFRLPPPCGLEPQPNLRKALLATC